MSIARLEQLEKEISVYDNAYHNLDLYLITDEKYDELVREYERLLLLFPDYSPSINPGQVENEGTVVGITEPMLSVAKINDWNKLLQTTGRYGDYTTEDKLDGVAVRVVYDQYGTLTFIHLKGTGLEGKDISHRRHLISGIPDVIDNDTNKMGFITGEVTCTKEDFREYQANSEVELGPERGVVSGFLRRNEASDDDGLLPLYFIAFNANKAIRDKFTTYPELKAWMRNSGFELPTSHDIIPKEKPESQYPIDGIVIKKNSLKDWDDLHFSGYNGYSVCYKYPSEVVRTFVKGVLWGVDARGYLTAVLTFKPVRIGLSNVSRCLFHYFDNYIKNGICIDAEIEVTKGNEIIPKLVSVVNNGSGVKIQYPENCPSCSEKLSKEGNGEYRCENTQCPGQLSIKLNKAVESSGFNIDGLGGKRIEALIESNTVVIQSQLFTLTQEKLIDIGLSKKVAAKILLQIEEAKQLPLCNWIYAAAIPHLGEVRCLEIQSYLKENPLNDSEDLVTFLSSEEMVDLFGIDGMKIISYVSSNYSALVELFEYIDFSVSKDAYVEAIPISITGTASVERRAIKKALSDIGYWVDNKVTKSSHRLLIGDKPSPGKIGLAERYDIPTISIVGLTLEEIVAKLEKRNV